MSKKIDHLVGKTSPAVADAARELATTFAKPEGRTAEKVEAELDRVEQEHGLRTKQSTQALAIAIASVGDVEQVKNEIFLALGELLKPPQLEELKSTVATHLEELANAPTVSDDTLEKGMQAAVRGKTTGDDPGFGRMRTGLSAAEKRQLMVEIRDWMSEEVGKNGDEVDMNMVDLFAAKFEEFLGVRVLRARNIPEMLREYGELFLQLLERQLPIALVAGGGDDRTGDAVHSLMTRMYEVLEKKGLANEIGQVGRLNRTPIQGAAFDAAEKISAIDMIGLGSFSSIRREAMAVNKPTLLGKNAGEESWLLHELAKRGVAIIMGGDDQAIAEAKQILASKPKNVIILKGFDARIDALELPEGAHVFDNAATKPLETGLAVAELLGQIHKTDNEERYASPWVKVAKRMAKGTVDVVQHLQQNAAAYRIGRICNAVQKKLDMRGVPAIEINTEMARLVTALAVRTHGYDNFSANDEWQERAREAFAEVGGRIGELVKDVKVDIYFASWFGIRGRPEEPTYFDKTVSEMPREVRDHDYRAKHAFFKDLESYGELRFDTLTAEPFTLAIADHNAGDQEAQPEVFIGTKDEMSEYYRARGFSVGYRASDSNGTEYLIATKGSIRKPVIVSVDSPARLKQVAALLELGGVDTSKMLVRGSLDRSRAMARNELELKLRNLDLPIGAVAFNNTGDVREAIREQLGPNATPIAVESLTAGPFKFDVVQVKGVGNEDEVQAFVLFKPAYGELTYDLMNAVMVVGARNILPAGAGGADAGGTLGALERITAFDFDGKLIELKDISRLKLLDVPGDEKTTDVVSVFHPSPVLQTADYMRQQVAKYGRLVVDQEYAAALAAIVAALSPRAERQLKQNEVIVEDEIHIMTGIHTSDVAGKGYAEMGTVDAEYTPNVKRMGAQFIAELGVAAVKLKDGTWAAVNNAKPGLLKEKPPTVDMTQVIAAVPDYGTVGAANGIDDIDQLKGQKRCLIIETRNASRAEMDRVREVLKTLDKDRFWLVCRADDPKQGELVEIAKQAGFESVVVATPGDTVLNEPTVGMHAEDADDLEARLMNIVQQGTGLSWHENYGLQYRMYVGDFEPAGDHAKTRVVTFENAQELKGARRQEVAEFKTALVRLLTKAGNDVTVPCISGVPDGKIVAQALVTKLMASITDPDKNGFDAAYLGGAEKLVYTRAAAAVQRERGPVYYHYGAASRPVEAPDVELRTRYWTSTRQAREVAQRMSGEVRQWLDGFEQAIEKRFDALGKAPPEIVSLEGLREAMGDKRPVMITGASGKSWPLMSLEERARAIKDMEALAATLDPSKVFIVTGGTDFGIEKHAHEIFGKRGFKIVGTLTEDATADYLNDISPYLSHVVMGGLNWTGKSRIALNGIIKRMNGWVIAVGGGEVVAREIEMALAFGLRLAAMKAAALSEAGEAEKRKQEARKKDGYKTVVASHWAAERYTTHGYKTRGELLNRLGISAQDVDPALLSSELTPDLLARAADLKSEGEMKKRYEAEALAIKAAVAAATTT